MRVLFGLVMLLAPLSSVSAQDYSEWHRDAFRVFSRLEDMQQKLANTACPDNDSVCEAQITDYAERVNIMIGRVEAVALSDDLTDSEGSVVDDSHALCDEIESFTGE